MPVRDRFVVVKDRFEPEFRQAGFRLRRSRPLRARRGATPAARSVRERESTSPQHNRYITSPSGAGFSEEDTITSSLDLEIPFHVERLANGLTVVVSPQRGIPLVTVDVTYDVGSRVEPPGKTGFAHLFEHLMFEGSENVGKGEHFRLVAEAGGSMNGTTSEDRTNYYETLPAECLDLALFLEADRMRALVLTQEKLDNQREAVKEEKRLRVDNQPYAPSFETADALAYDAFAYKHPVIGSMDDLGAASLDDARDFYRRYYAPGNALLAVVGDVEPGTRSARVEDSFEDGPGPRDAAGASAFDGARPVRRAARRASTTRHAAMPALHVNFKVAGAAPPRPLRPLVRGADPRSGRERDGSGAGS